MAPHLPKDPGLEGPSWSLGGSEMNPRDDSTKGPFGGLLGRGGLRRMDRKISVSRRLEQLFLFSIAILESWS